MWVGRVFFIWTSVFNLFVVPVFWALLVDLFTAKRGKRLFGVVAAGTSVGAIVAAWQPPTVARSTGQSGLPIYAEGN